MRMVHAVLTVSLCLVSPTWADSTTPRVKAHVTTTEAAFVRPRVVILALTGKAPEGVRLEIERVLAATLGANPHLEVLSDDEVRQLLDVQALRQSLSLPTDAQLFEIGKKLDTRFVIVGSADPAPTTKRARADESDEAQQGPILVHMRLLDVERARVVARENEKLQTVDGSTRALSRAAAVLVDTIVPRPHGDMARAAAALADSLVAKTPKGRTIEAGALAYADTPFSSRFGRVFAERVSTMMLKKVSKKGVPLRLEGTYAERGDSVELVGLLVDPESGEIAARAQTRMVRGAIPMGYALEPENLESEARDQERLDLGAVKSFTFSSWTERGARGVVFYEGEEFHVFVRADRAVYVRLIYHLANGKRVVMEEAFFVDASQANRVVRLPTTFEVAAPFGVERIHVIAFVEKPSALTTKDETIDGTRYRVVPTLDEALRFRGFKPKTDIAYTAETIITLTTSARP